MRPAAVIALVFVLGGCANTGTKSVPASPEGRAPPAAPSVNLAGYPPDFKAGYADGCASARSASRTRDEQRYKSDANYAQGWRDGNDICRKK